MYYRHINKRLLEWDESHWYKLNRNSWQKWKNSKNVTNDPVGKLSGGHDFNIDHQEAKYHIQDYRNN